MSTWSEIFNGIRVPLPYKNTYKLVFLLHDNNQDGFRSRLNEPADYKPKRMDKSLACGVFHTCYVSAYVRSTVDEEITHVKFEANMSFLVKCIAFVVGMLGAILLLPYSPVYLLSLPLPIVWIFGVQWYTQWRMNNLFKDMSNPDTLHQLSRTNRGVFSTLTDQTIDEVADRIKNTRIEKTRDAEFQIYVYKQSEQALYYVAQWRAPVTKRSHFTDYSDFFDVITLFYGKVTLEDDQLPELEGVYQHFSNFWLYVTFALCVSPAWIPIMREDFVLLILGLITGGIFQSAFRYFQHSRHKISF